VGEKDDTGEYKRAGEPRTVGRAGPVSKREECQRGRMGVAHLLIEKKLKELKCAI